MKLSIVIPIYNERFWVHPFWERLKTAPIKKCDGIREVEILIVDDGSTDGTTEILRKLTKESFTFNDKSKATVTLVESAKNKGKGHAVRKGIKQSTGDVLIIQDADFEYNPSDFPSLVAPITTSIADVVYGSRFRGNERRVIYFWHSMVNGFITFLSNALFNLNLTDVEVGYKAFRGSVIRSLCLTANDFAIEIELTARIAKAKLRIFEVPIRYHGRTYQEGKKIRALDGLKALWAIVKFAFFDSRTFQAGLDQTLNTLNSHSDVIYEPILKNALESLPKKEGELRILEVGSGIGTLSRTLGRYGELVATDISDDYVRTLQDQFAFHPQIHVDRWDATKPLPKKYGKFDLVVSFNVLEHLENDTEALKNWKSLLNPGGHLIVLTPNYPKLFCPIDTAAGHYRRYSKKQLIQCLRDAGLNPGRTFYGNSIGIVGWMIFGVFLQKSTINARSLNFYAFLKPLVKLVERQLDKFLGLSIIVISENPAKIPEVTKRAA